MAGVRSPVYHIHGTKYWKNALDRIYLKFFWRINSLFRVVYLANSRYSADVFQKQVLPVRPQLVYNGFQAEAFLKKRKKRGKLRRLAFSGRLHPGKNVDLVFRLFEEIAAERPELELHIAGDGMLRAELEARAAGSGFGSRIVFHGWVQDMPSFYADVDLLVFLSAFESFGNVVLEALLTGLPVLTSDLPSFEEIHDGEKAFSLGHPSDFEAVRQQFLASIDRYEELAQRAFDMGEQLHQKFAMEKHLAEISKVYHSISEPG
jgi:glycosyltransferase involved in cell wall biosynthesis